MRNNTSSKSNLKLRILWRHHGEVGGIRIAVPSTAPGGGYEEARPKAILQAARYPPTGDAVAGLLGAGVVSICGDGGGPRSLPL